MTSIEWLLEQVEHNISKTIIEQAKEMHKQEIIDAFSHTEIMSGEYFQVFDNAEEYYQETFVSKGSDETSDFDKPFMHFAKQYVEQLKTKK